MYNDGSLVFIISLYTVSDKLSVYLQRTGKIVTVVLYTEWLKLFRQSVKVD